MSNDPVNRPSHYTEGRKFETIEVIEDWGLGFCLGNTVKYISRAGRKVNHIEDLKKARWYLDREIAAQEAEAPVENEVPFTFTYEDVLEDATADPEAYGCSVSVCVDPWDPSLGPQEPSEEENRICEATSADWADFWRADISQPEQPEWDTDDSWMLDSTKSN